MPETQIHVPCKNDDPHQAHNWNGDDVRKTLIFCEGVRAAKEPSLLDATRWWTVTAEADSDAFIPKFEEYGSEDLRDIGRKMESIIAARSGKPPRNLSDEEATEVGIYFYLEGKLARWHEALKRGDRPSDDTLLDLTIYTMMARMNRAGGMRK